MGVTFQEWMQPWGGLGLGLSLWDPRGRLAEYAQSSGPFWDLLIRHSVPYLDMLRAAVMETGSSAVIATLPDSSLPLSITLIPIELDHQTHSVIAVSVLKTEIDDEECFRRLCSTYQLDEQLTHQLIQVLPRYTDSQVKHLSALLTSQAQLRNGEQLSKQDMNDLSTHLAQAYEELNLIYRISGDLTVSKPPSEHFEELCQQLAQATVIEGYAAILEPKPESNAEPLIIVSGSVSLDQESLLRLYQQLRSARNSARPSLVVVNATASQEEYAWLADRVEQFAYFPLVRKEHVFGGVLALNREDRADLGSGEVRLVNSVVERGAAFLESAALYDDLEQLFMGMLHALVSSIDAKDPYTFGHSQRVAWLSRQIGQLMGKSDEECQRIYLSGLLHDIGKIGVTDTVLCKAGRLTPDEYALIKMHPEIGARILEGVRQVDDLIPGVLYHHERYDGRGYPAGLKGDEIPLMGRIIGLADSFDAMTTSRIYRSAQSPQSAAQEIERCVGSQFDPEAAKAFLSHDSRMMFQEMKQAGQGAVRRDPVHSVQNNDPEESD